MKKFLSLLLAFVIVIGAFSIIPTPVKATSEYVSDDFVYELLDNSTAKITAYNGNATELCIPLTLDGYAVTALGYIFDCQTITSVYIPSTIVEITSGSFAWCGSLKKMVVDEKNPVYDSRDNCNAIIETATNTLISSSDGTTIPNSVTCIASNAFAWRSQTHITIPESITDIQAGAFYHHMGMESIVLPGSIEYINRSMFAFSIGLKNVIIGDGIKSIGDDAFNQCRELESVVIPASVEEIGHLAFYWCDNLTIYSFEGSYAQEYAELNDIPFVAITEYPSENPLDAILGDTDGDGKINIADATKIQKHLAMLEIIPDERIECADVDGDGKIAVMDATKIQKFLAKLIPSL